MERAAGRNVRVAGGVGAVRDGPLTAELGPWRIALTDEDRWPWLDRLRDELATLHAARQHAVLACSALKRVYRMRLAHGAAVSFVHLKGERELIASRLLARSGHYMPPSLLTSQFDTLEEPEDAYTIDIALPVDAQVRLIARGLAEKK